MGKTKPREVVQTFIISKKDGSIKALYVEGARFDMRKIGRILKARKISDVKFNEKTQLWEAVDRKSGKVIASARTRKGCVEAEHLHYEKQISKGKYPWKR